MAYEYITQHDSPNYWADADLAGYGSITFETITIHHWGDPANNPQFQSTVDWLCRANGNTSAHEVIEAGRVAQVINFGNAAWHSGSYVGNTSSYSLELNPRAWDSDYQTAAERIADIWATYGHKPLVMHRDWSATACPGAYDIERLEGLAWDVFNAVYGSGVSTPTPAPQPAPAPVPAPAASGYDSGLRWIVDPGNTLGGIAAHYGISMDNLAAFNGITDPNRIDVGQVLSIPGPLAWIVDPGDTLGGIAAHYGISVDVLASRNGITDPNRIDVGQVLTVG